MTYQKLLDLSDDWLKYAIHLNLCHESKDALVELRNAVRAKIHSAGACVTPPYFCFLC